MPSYNLGCLILAAIVDYDNHINNIWHGFNNHGYLCFFVICRNDYCYRAILVHYHKTLR